VTAKDATTAIPQALDWTVLYYRLAGVLGTTWIVAAGAVRVATAKPPMVRRQCVLVEFDQVNDDFSHGVVLKEGLEALAEVVLWVVRRPRAEQ